MLRYGFVFLFAVSCLCSTAQTDTEIIQIQLLPMFHGEALQLSESLPTSVSTFKCYLSAFELEHEGRVVWSEKESYHLIDASEQESLLFAMNIPSNLNYDKLLFRVGIDSLTSVSGAYGGDLDPTKGMYWTWNSGYIHFKLEGSHPLSTERNNEFEFHLGGYLPPHATYQVIALEVSPSSRHSISIDLDRFLSKSNIQKQPRIMSAGAEAHALSLIVKEIFSTEDGTD